MTTDARVITENEVFINGHYYKTTRPVNTTLASQYPAKVLTGDIDANSQQHLSAIRWSDNRGGIGKKDHEDATDVTRIWYGTSYLRQEGHRTLPGLVTRTAAAVANDVNEIADLNEQVYASFGLAIYKYTLSADSWASVHTSTGSAISDSMTARWGGTVYMVFASTTKYSYTSNGSSWTEVATAVRYIADWDDRIWGIDNSGQLRWAFDPTGTWTNDAQLPLPAGYVQSLFVARDAAGEPVLYVGTKVGLYIHDFANNRFIKTDLEMPFHPNGGRGVARWRDSTYYPAGLAIYKYNVTGGSAVISIMGPDRDQGLPSTYRGRIRKLEATHNDLMALIDAPVEAPANDQFLVTGGMSARSSIMSPLHNGAGFQQNTGTSVLLAYNGIGWQVIWESGANTLTATSMHVAYAYNNYRLWWGHDQRVYWTLLPIDIVNPQELTTRIYADSSRDDFPWFDAGQSEIDKLGVRLTIETSDCTPTETVTPYYGLDYNDTTWTALDKITSNGKHIYYLPNLTENTTEDAEGLEFRAIRFRTDLARGSNNTRSPDVNSITLEYRKKLPARYGWSVELDINADYKGYTPREQELNLREAIAKNKRVQFTFRDDESNTRNYWCDILQVQGLEYTAHREGGVVRLVLSEL